MKKSAFLAGVVFVVAVAAMGCKSLGPDGKCKSILDDMEDVVTRLREVEKASGRMLARRGSMNKEVCREKLGLEKLQYELKKIRKRLDKIMPEDMPMESNTIQAGVDPVTGHPRLETSVIVDWGKVTGKSQEIWANLHTAYNSLAAAVNTAEVACKCMESEDKKSLSCGIVSFQLEPDRLNLELDSTEEVYLAPVREIISGK